MAELEKIIEKNKTKISKSVKDWLNEESNRKRLYDDEINEIINPFISSSGNLFKKNLPRSLYWISYFQRMKFLDAALQFNYFDKLLVGKLAIYRFWHYKSVFALMTSADPGGRDGYSKSTVEFADILLFLAIDWPDHARDGLDTLLDYWEAGFRSGQVPFEIVPDYPGWFAIKLARQWLGDAIDERYELEPADEELKSLNGVLRTWHNPDVSVFQTALDEAATFHALESGENRDSWTGDERFAIPDNFYWFFPVELLAACRLRQYKGLIMPKFTHPLFEATVMGPLPTTVPVPKDDMLDQILPLFAKVTGNLEM
jgi:hypothetical protein